MIKPTIFLFFVFGIAGYAFLRQYHGTLHSLNRSNGYHTFFVASAVGIVLFSISALIYFFLYRAGLYLGVTFDLGRWILTDVFFKDDVKQDQVALIDISMLSVALGALLPNITYLFGTPTSRWRRRSEPGVLRFIFFILVKRPIKLLILEPFERFLEKRRESISKSYLKDSESTELSRLLAMSLEHRLPILFTMSDNKVFIGYPLFIPVKPHNDIYILPVVSGYRCKDTRAFSKVTDYTPVVELLVEKEKEKFKRAMTTKGVSAEDVEAFMESDERLFTKEEQWKKFTVALPCREIVHAHLHDLELESIFHQQESERLGNSDVEKYFPI
ncbi:MULTISPECIES: hypothetical protein [Vibrio]|uniref:Uncharacterized protein n=1 Tax=Vibrio bivalvicida TaxID=1276888 RepID=A0A177Y0X0_9VIBR|nr:MULTISPECIES: hypothetical protein [Vibrio]KLN65714.1 hypothetical protein ZX61_08925 [Vibrio sp. VPAP30]OAJ94471.1 hypothetical protein APB76_09130 [Vibrio bivalvicida]